jgi:hypothetical protein
MLSKWILAAGERDSSLRRLPGGLSGDDRRLGRDIGIVDADARDTVVHIETSPAIALTYRVHRADG